LGGGSSPEGGSGNQEQLADIEPGDQPAISRLGDLWLVGQHRLLCGNSLEPASYDTLLSGEKAQMICSDGPYGVAIKGNVSSRKSAREFEYGCGNETAEEFIQLNATVFGHLVRHSIDGSIHYHFISWHHMWELLSAGREQYTELKNILIWSKTHGARGFYRSQYEAICVFKQGKAPHICTFGIEKGARVRSNVITMAGCNSFGPTRDEDLADHPTVKPKSLIADLIRDCSNPNGIILDPYSGSGTTILAAEMTRRRARAIELDPLYVDVAIRRWEKMTGQQAVLEATGQTFAEVEAERVSPADDEEGQLDG
jgi:DNA modification methylase